MSEWQDISTAPKDGTYVLLWSPDFGGDVQIGSFRVDGGFSGNDDPLWLNNTFDDFSVGYASVPLSPSHWMPLPTPPAPQE